jgi:hypothetical protein
MNFECHELKNAEPGPLASRTSVTWITQRKQVNGLRIGGNRWSLSVIPDTNGQMKIVLENQLNGLEDGGVSVELDEHTPSSEDLMLRIPSPARLERQRAEREEQMEEAMSMDVPTVLDTRSAPMDEERETPNMGSAMLPQPTETPARLFTPTGPPAAGATDAQTAGLAYGIDPAHIAVASETASEMSSISLPGADTRDGALIRNLIDHKFRSMNVKYGRSIQIRKAKIFGVRKPTGSNNLSTVTLFLAGRWTPKMMDSPLNLKQGDIIEMSMPTGAPTPGKESEREDNEKILREVFRLVTSVVSA